MRNLKKFLALVLAMMMVMGLMVTVNAASDKYTPDDTITPQYQTAVDVLFELDVLQGDSGAYSPQGTITRKEFAMMLYRIVTGETDDTTSYKYASLADFADVDNDAWFAGAIGYCQNTGILKGDGGAGSPYRPDDNVNGYEVLTGLLRAVGYGKRGEYDDANWAIVAASNATSLGMRDGLLPTTVLSQAATRETVAQLFFTTLTTLSPVVWQDGNGSYGLGIIDDPNNPSGAPTIGELNFNMVVDEDNEGKLADFGINPDDYYDPDDFGRPGANSVLVVNGKVMYAEYPTPDYTFYGKVTEAAAFKAMTKKVVESVTGTWSGTIDGDGSGSLSAPVQTTTTAWNGTGVGAVTEVYLKDDGTNINATVVTYYTYIGTVSKVTEAKGDDPRTITIKNESSNEAYAAGSPPLTKETESFKKGDVVLYTYAASVTGADANDPGVQSVQLAPSVSGKLQTVVNDGAATGTYTIVNDEGSAKYVHSVKYATGKDLTSDGYLGKDVTFYTDTQDNIMMVASESETAATNYIYVVAHSAAKDNEEYIKDAAPSCTVNLYGVTPDGEIVPSYVAKFAGAANSLSAPNNGFKTKNGATGLYKYTVNKDGTLNLTKVEIKPTANIKANATSVVADNGTTYILNSKTAYVYVDIENRGTDNTVNEAYPVKGSSGLGAEVGFANTYLGVSNGVVEVVFFIDGYVDPNAPATGTGEYVLVDVTTEKAIEDADDGDSFQYSAYTSDGEKIDVVYEVPEDGSALKDGANHTANKFETNYLVCELNDDGTVTLVKKNNTGDVADGTEKVLASEGLVDEVADDTVSIGVALNIKHYLRVGADVSVAPIGDIETSTLTKGAKVIYVRGTTTGKNATDLLAAWIVEDPDSQGFELDSTPATFDGTSSNVGITFTATVEDGEIITGDADGQVKNYFTVTITASEATKGAETFYIAYYGSAENGGGAGWVSDTPITFATGQTTVTRKIWLSSASTDGKITLKIKMDATKGNLTSFASTGS